MHGQNPPSISEGQTAAQRRSAQQAEGSLSQAERRRHCKGTEGAEAKLSHIPSEALRCTHT